VTYDDAAVAARVERIRDRIVTVGGDPARVRIVAVTKGHGAEAVRAALAAGVFDVGESYAQELVAKAEQCDAEVRWHMIGRLQRNKVRKVAPFVHLWQSIDRLSLAGEVANQAPGAAVLVQVNVSGAGQQGGCAPEQVATLVEGCGDLGLDVRGLMAIGPLGAPEGTRAAFRRVRALADQLRLPERSMGMSDDMELAVAEGSTMVRIGTALFGPRGGTRFVGN
jgi:pyridoxal phosphate enzyme (YggS family)